MENTEPIQENTEPIQFQFVGIQVLAKSMEKIPQGGLNREFNFDLKVDTKVNTSLKLVMPVVSVSIKQREIHLGSIVVACLFEVVDFDNRIIKNEEGLYVIPPHLENIIRPVSISTCRGIMYSEFKATHLQ